MSLPRRIVVLLVALLLVSSTSMPVRADGPSARHVLNSAVTSLLNIYVPQEGQTPKTLVATLKVTKCQGLGTDLTGTVAKIAYQAPDRLRVEANVFGDNYLAGRIANQIWIDEPSKHFAVLGQPGELRFKADPKSIDDSVVPAFSLPLSITRIKLLLLAVSTKHLEPQTLNDEPCDVIEVTPRAAAAELLHIEGAVELWVRQSDQLPIRAIYRGGDKVTVQVDASEMKLVEPWDANAWALHPAEKDHVETVAVSHLLHLLDVGPAMALEKCPTLPPPAGDREVVATEGKGRLETIDGARVLYLKGSPEEMGHQHGVLLHDQIHAVSERILYGVGVGSSFARGAWFFGEIERAEKRLEPFMDPRYLAEEDAMATAAGMDWQESRLANFFPELFHCSGFAVFGKATGDGHLYHGRVLDYLRGVGLEQNAVTIVHQPDYGHAWVNISYAGFIGSVTAMNDQGISIGEMGGGGYGNWDGKPMAHLVREVMEKASTLDEAIKIMHDSPRTCDYYYVISDGKTHDAVAIAATPGEFTTLRPGQSHPRLKRPQQDCVLLSAGKRYDTLVDRVTEGYGHLDMLAARKLMDPPVCMSSNIQSVLFCPDTLDFWVANADAKNVASKTRYTHFNLKKMLASESK